MAEALKDPVQKKRQARPGMRRLTVVLAEETYKRLAEVAVADMREPNNLLSFLLKDQLALLLKDHVGMHENDK